MILAIDTTLGRCSAALWRAGRTHAALSEPLARGHAERLAPLVQEVMATAGAGFTGLSRIVVTTGPGSFTGVRVGLAFARGAALARAIPCVGVSTLRALALPPEGQDPVAPLIPTAYGAYLALYRGRDTLVAPVRLDAAAAAALIAEYSARTVGPGAADPAVGAAGADAPDPAALAAFGADLDPAGHPPAPTYLRDADAEPAPP